MLTVQYATGRAGLPHRRSIEAWLAAGLTAGRVRRRALTVTVRFVGRAEARSLNRRFRRRDYATNVLTFVYVRSKLALEGDIILCAPVVATEARAQGKSPLAHYAHLVVHGMLHLDGLDHERDERAAVMERREKAILARLGYADPYLQR